MSPNVLTSLLPREVSGHEEKLMEFIQKFIWISSELWALYAIRFKCSLYFVVLVRQAIAREADLHYEHRSSQESWNQKAI